MAARSVPEWIGATPDTPAPARVHRRSGPLTIDHIRSWSIVCPETGCWLWQRAISTGGYAALREGRKTKRAHRRAYELHHGVELPREIDACHSCDRRACVNPEHIFAGSRADNMRDCADKGRIVTPGLSGEALTQSKLTAFQAAAIRSDPRSQRVIARAFGVSRRTVQFIKADKTWRTA